MTTVRLSTDTSQCLVAASDNDGKFLVTINYRALFWKFFFFFFTRSVGLHLGQCQIFVITYLWSHNSKMFHYWLPQSQLTIFCWWPIAWPAGPFHFLLVWNTPSEADFFLSLTTLLTPGKNVSVRVMDSPKLTFNFKEKSRIGKCIWNNDRS